MRQHMAVAAGGASEEGNPAGGVRNPDMGQLGELPRGEVIDLQRGAGIVVSNWITCAPRQGFTDRIVVHGGKYDRAIWASEALDGAFQLDFIKSRPVGRFDDGMFQDRGAIEQYL